MTPLAQPASEEGYHAFLTSCITTSAGLGWKGFGTYELIDPGLAHFTDKENHLYILNWIALCFASHPSTHAAVSLSSAKGHSTLHVVTKGGESYLRSTAGDNEFVHMTHELLKRQAIPSTRTSDDMFQDQEFAEEYLIRWCWPAFLGKVQALQTTLLRLGEHGHLDGLINKWVKYREGSSLPFDQASVLDSMHSKHSREAPKNHPFLSKESLKASIQAISSKTGPETTTKMTDTLAKGKHTTYYEIMKSCLALNRCDFIRASIDGATAVGDMKWRKLIDSNTQVLMDDLFHQVQRILEYHLGLITYLSHGLPYFRAALAANNGDLKKALSIHYVTSPTTPATLTSVTLKDAPKVWIPKMFSENGIEKSILTVSDKEVEKLISICEHFWKAGEVIRLTTHSVCDMAHYIVHEGKDFNCEAIGTSDIPCMMCDIYVSRLRNPRDQKKVKLRFRPEMTVFHRTWTPPPHTDAQMKSLISNALGLLNTSMRMYLTKNGLRGIETDQSALDSFGLTNADLASME